MNFQFIRHTWREVRRQPAMNLVGLAGTAFAIFLIMVVVVVGRVDSAEYAPVSHRDRMLFTRGVDIWYDNGTSRSSYYSMPFIQEIYGNLEGAEAMAVYGSLEEIDIAAAGRTAFEANLRATDAGYWDVFDFDFVSGSPYKADKVGQRYGSSTPAVICASVARRLYGSEDAEGREILLGHKPYRVAGVVDDVSPHAYMAYSQIWIPIEGPLATAVPVSPEDFFGDYQVALLARIGGDMEGISEAVRERYAAANRRLKTQDASLKTHGQPYDHAVYLSVGGTNSDPEPRSERLEWLVYAILLLIPAIHLSSMTNSLLRQRRMELGVRRAVGCRRMRVMRDIFVENLLVTLAGGLVGLVSSWIFILLFVDSFVGIDTWETIFADATIPPQLLFSWTTFGLAMVFCFILNLMSIGIPAFNASRMNPVEAISDYEK